MALVVCAHHYLSEARALARMFCRGRRGSFSRLATGMGWAATGVVAFAALDLGLALASALALGSVLALGLALGFVDLDLDFDLGFLDLGFLFTFPPRRMPPMLACVKSAIISVSK